MPSSKEEQVQKENEAIKITRGEKSNTNSCSKYKCIIPALALIIALVALGAIQYTISLNKQLQKQLTDENASFAEQIKQLEQKQSSAQELIEAKTTNAEEMQTKFDNLSKELQNAMQQRYYQNQDWILLKARYYLELAQINSHWSDNSDSALALLEEADHILQQVNVPKVLEVRQSIAKDIAKIQAIPRIDVVGILSQLDAAQNSINELSIPVPARSKPSSEQATKGSSDSSSWRSHFQDSMDVLEKLVVIRRHDQNVQPLLSPLLENILKENLRLNLQEAQWAVLNNNPSVYQLVLQQTIKKLKVHFNENMPNTAALIKKLTALEQINISPKRPDIGSALPLLNELLNMNKSQVNQPVSNAQGGNQ